MDASQVANITEMMYALRNPAGVPTWPIVFVGLGVLTFALHILFVQLMLGTSAIALFGALRQDQKWRQLGSAMIDVAKVSVSVAIVVGVAPLLFVQVVYDPHWYTSNVLSARWVIAFIVILILAYWAMYYFYFKNSVETSSAPKAVWALVISIALMLVVGFIMHSLTSQILRPELWQEWFMQNEKLDYSGAQLHAYNPVRFAFFIAMSIPVAGAMLISYRRFKRVRPDYDQAFLDWVGELGKKWVFYGSLIAFVFYIGWMMNLPATAGDFATSIWSFVGGVFVLLPALWVKLRLNGSHYNQCSYMALPIALVAGLVIAITREMLRYGILNDFFNYNFMDYKLVMDWYSTGLFFLTFAIFGATVMAYLLTIAWKSGQTVGVYTPSAAIDRLGTISIWVILIWIIQFFVVGIYVWVQ